MAYPADIYSPRTKANLFGVVYDSTDQDRVFAEDVQSLDSNVVALENKLGITGAVINKCGGLKPDSNSATALQFQNAAGTAILNIDTSNNRVGINVTDPVAELQINGWVYIKPVDDGDANLWMKGPVEYGCSIWFSVNNDTPVAQIYVPFDDGTYFDYYQTLSFRTGYNGTEVARLTADDGYLGLNCSPTARLHVRGTSLASSGIYTYRYSADVYAGTILGFKARGTIASPANVAASDRLVTIQGNGRVGAAAPSGGAIHILAESVDATEGSEFIAGMLQISLTDSAGSSYTRLTITSAGRVGIGDVSPQGFLEVRASVNALADVGTSSNYLLVLANNNNTNNQGAGLAFAGTTTDGNIGASIIMERTGSNGQGALKFYTKQSTTSGVDPVLALTIDQNGDIILASGSNLGINTTSPTALLDINSDILRLRTAKTPASVAATGNAGDICWDADNVYVCVATDTWKKAAIATW